MYILALGRLDIYFKGTGLMEEAKLMFVVYLNLVRLLWFGTGAVSVSDGMRYVMLIRQVCLGR
jgi:hypothetical protein